MLTWLTLRLWVTNSLPTLILGLTMFLNMSVQSTPRSLATFSPSCNITDNGKVPSVEKLEAWFTHILIQINGKLTPCKIKDTFPSKDLSESMLFSIRLSVETLTAYNCLAHLINIKYCIIVLYPILFYLLIWHYQHWTSTVFLFYRLSKSLFSVRQRNDRT